MKHPVLVMILGMALSSQPAIGQDEPDIATPEREKPALPEGLDDDSSKEGKRTEQAPALPPGLGGDAAAEQAGPALPAGLGRETLGEKAPGEPEKASSTGALADSITGFWDVRAGVRLREDPNQRATSLGETRLQLSRDQYAGGAVFRVTADLVYDNVADSHKLQPEQGRGWLDLREAYVGSPVGESLDARIGRQVLTWGVGDLLFLNDLFPKDWQSFFSGRDVEYLKAPSDAVMVSMFPPWFNIDLVYMPRFDADRYIRGERLSYWNPQLGRTAGRDAVVAVARPDDWFSDDEWALRLSKNLAGYELALYGYSGFWKSPGGFDPASGRATFPKLSVYG